jgi:hypothetical protein
MSFLLGFIPSPSLSSNPKHQTGKPQQKCRTPQCPAKVLFQIAEDHPEIGWDVVKQRREIQKGCWFLRLETLLRPGMGFFICRNFFPNSPVSVTIIFCLR